MYQFIKNEISSGRYRESGDELALKCFNCGKPDHLYFNPRRGVYHCFLCGVGGSHRDLVRSDLPFWNPRRPVSRARGGTGEVSPSSSVGTAGVSGYPIHPDLAGGPLPWLSSMPNDYLTKLLWKRAREYLAGRGVGERAWFDHRLFLIPHDPRVYVPFWNEKGDLVYYTGRLIGDSPGVPKTVEPPGSEKPLFGSHLFGSESCPSELVLVEGYFDFVATPNSVALMGSEVTRSQIESIERLNPDFVLVILDPMEDVKTRKVASSISRSGGVKAVPVLWDGDCDPGSLGPDDMARIVNHCVRQVRRKGPGASFRGIRVPSTMLG